MRDGAAPQNSYERKLKLILNTSLARYKGCYTPEQYDIEHRVAEGYLVAIGVKP